MTTKENQIKKLLQHYNYLSNEIMNYTSIFHDDMYFDIQGYVYEDVESIDIEKLKIQVKSFELILKGIKGLNYMYC